MIEWNRVEEKLPADNDECLLYSTEAGHVIGPIHWKAHGDSGMWLDLFGPYATSEAGATFSPGGESGPTHWAIWNEPAEPSNELPSAKD